MKGKSIKHDNRGVTMVLVLVTIVVISVLASLILYMSVNSFRVHTTDYQARQNFYSAEVAANEIYSGIGTYSIDILGQAYASTLNNVSVGGLNGEIIHNDSTNLNQSFKEEYMANMITYMTGITNVKYSMFRNSTDGTALYSTSTPNKELDVMDDGSGGTMINTAVVSCVMSRLNNCITNVSSGVVISLNGSADDSHVEFDFNKFALIINDVHVAYNDGELQSNETFDIEITFPDWNMSFYDAATGLGNPFVDYVCLGDAGVNFNDNTSVTGGVYGGGKAKTNIAGSVSSAINSQNGIRINHANVTIDLGASTNPDSNAMLVSNGDIVVKSSTSTGSSLTVKNGKIWCSNFLIDSNKSATPDKESTVNFDANTKLFVKDDYEVYGDKNTTTIKGSYYGYGMNMSNDDEASASSSILINGNEDKLEIDSGTNEIYIAGRAYINLSTSASPAAVGHITGESIAIKANQSAYMIPASMLNSGFTNPCQASVFNGHTASEAVKESSLPTGLSSLLSAKKYVAKYSNAKYYFYFDFTEEGAISFIRGALAGTYGDDIRNSVRLSQAAQKANISVTAENMYTSGSVVTGNVTGSGATAVPSFSASAAYATGSLSSPNIANLYTNYNNRFDFAKFLLIDVKGTAMVYDKRSADTDGDSNPNTYSLGSFNEATKTPFVNYVDVTKLRSATYNNVDFTGIITDPTTGTDVKAHVITKVGDCTVSSTDSTLVTVVVCDGNVTVTSSFKGMIFASGSITIDGTAATTLNAAAAAVAVDTILNYGTVDGSATGAKFGELFYYYATPEDSDGLENVDEVQYSDVINYANWRKY